MKPRRRHRVACALLIGLAPLAAAPLAASSDARATPPADTAAARAFARFGDGEQLFKAGRFDEAAATFEAAWALYPDPAYSFNAGLAHEKACHWDRAIAWYTKLLASAPDSPNRAEVEAHVAEVRRLQALARETRRSPERTGSWIAWGIGGAALVTGGILGGLALGRYDDASALAAKGPLGDADWARFQSMKGDVRGLSAGADVCFGLALTGAIVGTVLWFTAGPASADAPSAARAIPGGAAWSF